MAGPRMCENRRLVLVAHSESARGLDIPNVDAVVIVGGAASAVEYMHLAGRTARCRLGTKSTSSGTV
eukprot:4491236-Amphidinium_carterae.1